MLLGDQACREVMKGGIGPIGDHALNWTPSTKGSNPFAPQLNLFEYSFKMQGSWGKSPQGVGANHLRSILLSTLPPPPSSVCAGRAFFFCKSVRCGRLSFSLKNETKIVHPDKDFGTA